MLTAVHDTTMYWMSHVNRELTSVIVRCMGQAPTRVTEQNRLKNYTKIHVKIRRDLITGEGRVGEQID